MSLNIQGQFSSWGGNAGNVQIGEGVEGSPWLMVGPRVTAPWVRLRQSGGVGRILLVCDVLSGPR